MLTRSAQKGFSLLEMLVAMVILGISLGVLYKAAGTSTRSVAIDERYAYAVELASSLLADNVVVPVQGLSRQGETGGGEFSWYVEAAPLILAESRLAGGSLQSIRVSVNWKNAGSERSVVLDSIVAGLEQ